MVGKGSEHLIRSVLRHVRAPEATRRCSTRPGTRYQHHYLAINGQHSTVYPGVVEGLAALRARGLRLACLTNKPTAFALPLLAAKGLDGFFDVVFGGDAFERKKPDPLPLLKTCEALGTRARAHADGRRLEQRRAGRARRRLPGGAGQLRLQPRRAGARRGCRRLRRLAGRARTAAPRLSPCPAARPSASSRPGSGRARCAAAH